MKQLVRYIVDSLVDEPEQVQIYDDEKGNRVHLDLRVAKNDMGRVIGKGGRVANSIRLLLRVAAARESKQVTLDVLEPK